jgi:UTP--glucose-1-phosphate uridylyltransferase
MAQQRKVTKVVIPVAGLGTRFLPATKALPKELLPIVSKPIIHHIVQEAVDAGIETVVFVTSRPKVLIEDYFDPGDLAAQKLEKAGKTNLIEETLALTRKVDIVSIRQYEPKGLGHAILQAKPVVEGQDFAVVLGDDIIRCPERSAIGQCLDVFQAKEEGSVVGVLPVPREATRLYGIVDPAPPAANSLSWPLTRFVEKPDPKEAPSEWALPGRYVFESRIIEELKNTKPGKNDEIQLTDAMQSLIQKSPFFATAMKGERFDTGDRLGYIMANVAFALDEPEHKEALRDWLQNKLRS